MTINNTNVKNLLIANNKGIGKTDLLPDTYSFTEDGTFVIKNVGTAPVTQDLIAAKFIQLYHAFLKDMPLEKKQDHLSALAVNCVDLNQYRGLNKPEKGKKIPTMLAEHLLTPEQYKRNCVKIALATIEPDKLIELFDDSFILKGLFFTPEQELTYLEMIDRDEREAAKFIGLTDAGFTGITTLKDKSIKASITFAQAGIAIPELAKLGYTLVSSAPDMATLSIVVVIKEGEAETLV
jgi:hypothetical protein